MTIFTSMLNETMIEISGSVGSEQMIFTTNFGKQFKFYHNQDCCENVSIEDICGDLKDLTGSPILVAEQVSSYVGSDLKEKDSYTWTFYKFATVKGHVTVRWLGSSNGYYSEDVTFVEPPLTEEEICVKDIIE